MGGNEIPKNRDEVTVVMKSATRMKSKTCVFGWEWAAMKSRRIGMKSRCDEVHYVDEVENLRFRLGMGSNEIPKDRDEVTDVMKSATRMKSKTCVFGWN